MGSNKLFKMLISLTLIIYFTVVYSQKTWKKVLPGIGTFSSPRISDFNNDGIGDIVLGAGRLEFMPCDSAVIAIDGKNGHLLWNVSASDQIFGSATLKDINNDSIKDVFIGGRSAELMAIDGSSGKVIWRFKVPVFEKNKWFNFYNPQFIPDQNNDGFEDILVSNGGDVWAEPYDAKRPAGNLVIIDGLNGHVISKAPMPDGKETYMSVSVLPYESDTIKNVIYGTGGETIGGSLYVTSLAEILAGDLSHSIQLATSTTKGFIGPAVWVDLNEDKIPDIVANSVDGRIMAFDGSNHKNIWSVQIPNTEAYSSLAIGNLTGDSIPDFFVSYAQGVWPKLEWSKQVMINGRNGAIEFEDSLGFYQTSTPIIFDIDNDGRDEALLSVNYQVVDSIQQKSFYTDLAVISFNNNEVTLLELKLPGHNVASTPWIGDVDKNGFIDIIYVHSNNTKKTYAFDGMQINRIDTTVHLNSDIKWGSYMGSEYNGVYKN